MLRIELAKKLMTVNPDYRIITNGNQYQLVILKDDGFERVTAFTTLQCIARDYLREGNKDA